MSHFVLFPYNPSMAVQSITILMGAINFVAGICILATILKFERLKTRTNFFIFNLIICACLYELAQAILSNIRANVVSLTHENLTSDDICINVKTRDFFILLMCAFANFLALEWYLETHKPSVFKKFNNVYKYVVMIIYFANLIGYIISFWQSCNEMPYMVLISVFLNALHVCFFMLMRFCSKTKSQVDSCSLLTGCLIILMILPSYIWRPIVFSMHKHDYSYFVLWTVHLIEMLLEWPIVYIPVCVAFILLNHDRLFRLAFNKLIKRKMLNRDEESELDGSQNVVVIV